MVNIDDSNYTSDTVIVKYDKIRRSYFLIAKSGETIVSVIDDLKELLLINCKDYIYLSVTDIYSYNYTFKCADFAEDDKTASKRIDAYTFDYYRFTVN